MLTLESEFQQLEATPRGHEKTQPLSSEELKASNEELQAMNEEARSVSEELETSKEELQSVNEELITVNQELKGKVEELAHSNTNLQNLIISLHPCRGWSGATCRTTTSGPWLPT